MVIKSLKIYSLHCHCNHIILNRNRINDKCPNENHVKIWLWKPDQDQGQNNRCVFLVIPNENIEIKNIYFLCWLPKRIIICIFSYDTYFMQFHIIWPISRDIRKSSKRNSLEIKIARNEILNKMLRDYFREKFRLLAYFSNFHAYLRAYFVFSCI